ncbi:kinase-like domain-containing protein [Rhizophagus clarus]|uniref:Kinase-like domain-containing protein n=1 Tax=Rhizophagus clarus TaxID=94130 RepID=A0A8H3QIH5_9GLOM|nr:kinase-like domain-containing protein [Rhizophagus clarus]
MSPKFMFSCKKIKNLFLNDDRGIIKKLNKKLNKLEEDLNEIFWLDKIVSNYTKSLKFKNPEDMLFCLNNLIEKNSKNINNINALLLKGMIHYSLYSYNDALDDFNRTLSISPNNVSAIICRGIVYKALKQYDKSLIDLDKSLEIASDSAVALTYRGATYKILRKYNETFSDINKSLEIKPDATFVLIYRGETYRMLKKYDEALLDLNRSLELEPDNDKALSIRGATYNNLKKYDDALSDFNESLRIDPNDTFALNFRGETYRMLKKYDKAILDFNRSLELEPNNILTLYFRGETYRMSNKYYEALLDFNRLLVLEPNNKEALSSRGETYRMLKKYDEALLDLNRSLELEPNDTFTLYVRGITYGMLNKYDEALLDHNRSLELEPNDTFALYVRGITYGMLNKYDEALLDFNRLLELEPNNKEALNSRGEAYRMLKKYDEALLDLNRSLELEPNDTFVLYARGIIYKTLKKYDKALLDFNRSLKTRPDDIRLLKDREEIYQVMRSNLDDIWEENEMDDIIEKVERINSIEGDETSTSNRVNILAEDQDIMTNKKLKEFDEVRNSLVDCANDDYGNCEECQKPNTGVKWCRSCNAKRLQSEFYKWTSENADIDNFIQQIQLKANSHKEVIEWIPFYRFKDVSYVKKGGFGTIFRSRWTDGYIRQWDNKNNEWIRYSEIDVALKSLDNSAQNVMEFLQVVGNQLKFRDKWVIAIYGITKNPETNDYMMVMQYANIGSIRKLLNMKFKELDWKEKLDILRSVAYGLALIHKEGLMHKDFHSGNFVGTSLFGNFKHEYYITDFGLCRPIGFHNSKIYGVLPYVAPEVLRGGNYTQASDIYSFGITMTEVLTSYPPYYNIPHKERLAVYICQGLRPKISRSEVPQLLLDMVNRCLDAEPQKRPSAKKLYRILQKYNIDRKDLESEFSKQINTIENSKEFPIYDPTKPMATHSKAIYTSRKLDYKYLSKPVNMMLEASNAINDELEAKYSRNGFRSCFRIVKS